jgi:DNA-binding PadR family transcriptional regulator
MAKTVRHLAQLELLVLLAIRRLGSSERHLAKIVCKLEERTSRDVNVANVYASLESMKQKGYLEGRREPCGRFGPGRKTRMIYGLTPLGDDELNLAVRDIFSMAEGVELWGRSPDEAPPGRME